ncbi:MAG: hypothetical protein H6727_05790 [Myxococcales bacterium]|nr:hypothetical protein [Myxococcales bacterium]
MTAVALLRALCLFVVSVPLLSLAVLGIWMLSLPKLPEHRVHQLANWTFRISFAGVLGVAWLMWYSSTSLLQIKVGSLFAMGGYHFDLHLYFDVRTLVMLGLNFALCGLIGDFSSRYIHRDEGYGRFYLLLLLFALGIEMIAISGSFDLLFVGWELVGLTSALLIAFFYRRATPTQNGLWAYGVYRFTDVGLLLAVLLLHAFAGSIQLQALSSPTLSSWAGVSVGALFLFGAMGKGGLVPFTGWLPRAMEGPTPSSAIFYGALSIHASPFLLLRVEPLLSQSVLLRVLLFALGLLTAAHASMVGRVQNDVKSSLAYASAAQVGLIWMEIAMGWVGLALLHLAGHAILRTWQLLRAPSVLDDRASLMEFMERETSSTGKHLERIFPKKLQDALYRVAVERWFLDDLLRDVMIRPVVRVLCFVDRLERRWTTFLGGAQDSEETQRQLLGESALQREASSPKQV